MQHVNKREQESRSGWDKASSLGILLLLVLAGGCGGNSVSTAPPATATQATQAYFAPLVEGTNNGGSPFFSPQNYTFDDAGGAFSQSILQISSGQQGSQLLNYGTVTPASRGLLSLGLLATYNSTASFAVTAYAPGSKPGGFAIELAGQAGALVQLAGQPVAPLVPSAQCPSIGTTAQTFQFLTIPGSLIQTAAAPQAYTWNPLTDTAYGSVDVSTAGSAVTFANIKQFKLSGDAPSIPAPQSPVIGGCGLSSFGNTISIPGTIVVSNPGALQPTQLAQAIANIGPSGLLVEDNGVITGVGVTKSTYQNTLGAGTGAVGLPKPTSALASSALMGAQYQGFIYGAGVYNGASATGWSSHLASFGFSSVPSSCASVAASTSTLIYGGDFPQSNGQDNPSASPDGFGNCDLAIDLGTQDTANNGLFPHATVWIGANYAANKRGITYSFPAVAIAGQLNNKYAIFVLGVDSTQPWEIDLLQSN